MNLLRQPTGTLDIWQTVLAAYRCVFTNLDDLLRRGWLAWIALFLATFAGPFVDQQVAFGLGWVVQWIAFATVGSAFAVSWHRKFLLNEPSSRFPPYRFDRRENRWLIAVVILYGGFFVLSQVVDILAIRGLETASLIVFIVGLVALLYFGSRILLALPLAALDSPQPLLRQSWTLTRRDWWRIAAGAILLLLPMGVAEYLLQQAGIVVTVEGSLFDKLALVFFSVGLTLLELALLATYASSAYRQIDPSTALATSRVR